jgi:hypothetical protein
MRLFAYFLLGDPRWLRESILSYYPLVDRIFAVGDVRDRGWDGAKLPVDECIDILKCLDVERKAEIVRADLTRLSAHPMQLDTEARQLALSVAGDAGADWVLQLDADEIATSLDHLRAAIARADQAGAQALDYPARWILGLARAGRRRDLYLEASDALGRVAAHYPGPVAVRPEVHLSYSRRAFARYYRVDVRTHNSYHEYTRSHPVHMTVPKTAAIMHLSWVQRGQHLKKAARHAHRDEHALVEGQELAAWRQQHPCLTIATNAFRASWGHPHRLRLTRLDLHSSPPRFSSLLAPSRT